MGIKKNIRPVTYMKQHSAELLSQVNDSRLPVIITQNGEPRAVIQDAQSYEKMRDTLLMLKIVAQGEADIRAGRFVSQKQVFSALRKFLRQKARRDAAK